MQRLYFDVETTGFAKADNTPLHLCPHVVQLAAILWDDDHGEVARLSEIIKPADWACSDDVVAVHGITTEIARKRGVPIAGVITEFYDLCQRADQLVAHNIKFDTKVIGYELKRAKLPNVVAGLNKFCTMEGSREACQLPARTGTKFKAPKLKEAHIRLFGLSFDGAHDALEDTRACQRIHRYLLDHKLIRE